MATIVIHDFDTKTSTNQKAVKSKWLLPMLLCLGMTVMSHYAYGVERNLAQNDNKDGRTDQMVVFNGDGRLSHIRIDAYKNGIMDTFQYYQNEFQISHLDAAP